MNRAIPAEHDGHVGLLDKRSPLGPGGALKGRYCSGDTSRPENRSSAHAQELDHRANGEHRGKLKDLAARVRFTVYVGNCHPDQYCPPRPNTSVRTVILSAEGPCYSGQLLVPKSTLPQTPFAPPTSLPNPPTAGSLIRSGQSSFAGPQHFNCFSRSMALRTCEYRKPFACEWLSSRRTPVRPEARNGVAGNSSCAAVVEMPFENHGCA